MLNQNNKSASLAKNMLQAPKLDIKVSLNDNYVIIVSLSFVLMVFYAIFETSFLKLWCYSPFLTLRSDFILKLGQKRPKFIHLVLLMKKGQTPKVIKLNMRNMFIWLILTFLNSCPPVMTSLTQNWFKKDLNLYIMYQQW